MAVVDPKGTEGPHREAGFNGDRGIIHRRERRQHHRYNQWTQFESFPQFMENVKSVQQTDDTHLRWVAVIGGDTREWDAEITEQIPDQRIAWSSISGEPNGGVVTFQPLSDTTTKVHLRLAYEPQGMLEKAGEVLGVVDRQIRGDLERFKRFVESRGEETGSWHSTVAA